MFDVLATVVAALDRAGIPHMVSGSVASARHGEARATQDIDLVIDPSPAQLDELHARLVESGWYVGDARSALEHRSQFNMIDSTSGWKVDLIIRRDRPFSRAEFERRRPVVVGGVAQQRDTIDWAYLRKWAERLSVQDLLDEASTAGE